MTDYIMEINLFSMLKFQEQLVWYTYFYAVLVTQFIIFVYCMAQSSYFMTNCTQLKMTNVSTGGISIQIWFYLWLK